MMYYWLVILRLGKTIFLHNEILSIRFNRENPQKIRLWFWFDHDHSIFLRNTFLWMVNQLQVLTPSPSLLLWFYFTFLNNPLIDIDVFVESFLINFHEKSEAKDMFNTFNCSTLRRHYICIKLTWLCHSFIQERFLIMVFGFAITIVIVIQ